MTESPAVLLLHGVQSSSTTWWRAAQDLADLGWRVHAIDLLGHGARAGAGPAELTLADLVEDAAHAAESATQPGSPPFDLVVGHSLGAIVALSMAAARPGLVRAVIAEDPPALGGGPRNGGVDPAVVAADIERGVALTTADAATQTALLAKENPSWASFDVVNDIENRLALDVNRVSRMLRTISWDLPALVAACPVPVRVLAATGSGTALAGPDRKTIAANLPPGHFREIASGHCIHRDRPALWLHEVITFRPSGLQA